MQPGQSQAGAAAPKKGEGKKLTKSTTSFAALASTVGGLFDRSNEQVQKTQDIIVNGGFFVLSCYIIYQYGHKLAV